MYAVIATGGKQYRVELGDIIFIEKLDVAEGADVNFDTLMVADGESVQVGTPLLDTKVSGKVLAHGKGAKIIVFKYKAKKNVRKKQGHRQPFTKVQITTIGESTYKPDPNAVPAAKPEKKAATKATPAAPKATPPKAAPAKPGTAAKAAAKTAGTAAKKPAAKTTAAKAPAAAKPAAKTAAAKPATKPAEKPAAKSAAKKPAAKPKASKPEASEE